MSKPVHLPGTTLEGGGQLLRIAVGISALTAIPIYITDIRGNRSGGGGLKVQHLAGVNWLAKACKAKASGAEQKSKMLEFAPSKEHGEKSSVYLPRAGPDSVTHFCTLVDQTTPGSIGLIFQAILPFILFSGQTPDYLSQPNARSTAPKIRLSIYGGTNVPLSPSYDYISQVLLPTLSKIGLPPIEAGLSKRGWTTGTPEIGHLVFAITPLARGTRLPAFSLIDRGEIVSLSATILAPKALEKQFRAEFAAQIHARILSSTEVAADIPFDVHFEDSGHSKRLYLLLVATSATGCKLGRDWLYDRRVKAERPEAAVLELVKRVVREMAAEIAHGGCVDEYMRDQLVVFQALAEGRSGVDGGMGRDGAPVLPSLHARTAEWVVKEVLGVECDGRGGCEGIGLAAGETYAERVSADPGNEDNALVQGVEGLQI